jgi:hypothetical protein
LHAVLSATDSPSGNWLKMKFKVDSEPSHDAKFHGLSRDGVINIINQAEFVRTASIWQCCEHRLISCGNNYRTLFFRTPSALHCLSMEAPPQKGECRTARDCGENTDQLLTVRRSNDRERFDRLISSLPHRPDYHMGLLVLSWTSEPTKDILRRVSRCCMVARKQR